MKLVNNLAWLFALPALMGVSTWTMQAQVLQPHTWSGDLTLNGVQVPGGVAYAVESQVDDGVRMSVKWAPGTTATYVEVAESGGSEVYWRVAVEPSTPPKTQINWWITGLDDLLSHLQNGNARVWLLNTPDSLPGTSSALPVGKISWPFVHTPEPVPTAAVGLLALWGGWRTFQRIRQRKQAA